MLSLCLSTSKIQHSGDALVSPSEESTEISLADKLEVATAARDVLYVSDSVNRGTSTAKRMQASLYDWIVYKRGSKARERKGEEGQRRSRFYAVLKSRELT